MQHSIIYRCEELMRDLANDIARGIDKNFGEQIIKQLKFSNPNDWIVLCSLMDVLDDTEQAKENFMKYDLTGPTKILDSGEQYLRLYGILNAIYLQINAIFTFGELVKVIGIKTIKAKIESSEILKLRHIAGAHTIDFIDDGSKNPHQFQRGMLLDGTITTHDSKGKFKEYDLKKIIQEYNQLCEEYLISSLRKFITTVFKNRGGNMHKEYLERLNLIIAEKSGDTVIYTSGKKRFVIRVSE